MSGFKSGTVRLQRPEHHDHSVERLTHRGSTVVPLVTPVAGPPEFATVGREATVVTTSSSSTFPSPISRRDPLRLTLAAQPMPGKLGGAWWPQSRDLAAELADLVDNLPEVRGRILRGLFSRPDWDLTLRKIDIKRGVMKVGSFLSDNTHLMTLDVRRTITVDPARRAAGHRR